MNLWDVRLNAGHGAELTLPAGHNTLLFVLSGRVELAGGETLGDAGLAVFGREGESISVNALENSKLLVLDGEPINEPVAAYEPFVMNSRAEIRQAFSDYQAGRMGQLVS